MSDLGRSVFSAVEFLSEFHKDVSRLLETVEERMTSEGLASLYGTTAFWKRSYTYYTPSGWMPRWLVRWYSQKRKNTSKGSRKAPWVVFFNVYLTPKRIGEPIAVWGFVTQPSDNSLWTPLSQLLITDQGPDFLRCIPVEGWKTLDEMPDRLSDFQYQARAVVEFCDAPTVDELVVLPLLAQVERLQQSS